MPLELPRTSEPSTVASLARSSRRFPRADLVSNLGNEPSQACRDGGQARKFEAELDAADRPPPLETREPRALDIPPSVAAALGLQLVRVVCCCRVWFDHKVDLSGFSASPSSPPKQSDSCHPFATSPF